MTHNELMVSSTSVYPCGKWYVAEYRRYPLLGIAKGVMNAALARHWLLLYVPIWIWVLTRISSMVEVWMAA